MRWHNLIRTVKRMRKAILLAALGLAMLGAIITVVYGVSARYCDCRYTTAAVERRAVSAPIEPPCISDSQNFTWNFRHCRRFPPGGKGFRGFEIELSEEFKERVLGIAKNDEDIQKLLGEGYNVSNVKVAHIKLVVQENGQVTMEADKAIVILTKDNSRALVEVDVKAEKVTRIKIVSVTVIEKGA